MALCIVRIRHNKSVGAALNHGYKGGQGEGKGERNQLQFIHNLLSNNVRVVGGLGFEGTVVGPEID